MSRRSELEAFRGDGDCCGMDPGVFFPEDGIHATEAKQICGGCPVANVCLAYAMTWHETGVWGGTTERDRRSLRRAARAEAEAIAAPAGTAEATEAA